MARAVRWGAHLELLAILLAATAGCADEADEPLETAPDPDGEPPVQPSDASAPGDDLDAGAADAAPPIRDALPDVVPLDVALPDVAFAEADAGPPPMPAIAANDQKLDLGTRLFIEGVQSAAPGWVVVYESGPDGRATRLLGATFVPAGTSSDVAVTLARPARNGEALVVRLHADGGVAGVFEEGDDAPVQADGGWVERPVVVEVPPGTPAVRLTVASRDTVSFDFVDGQPPAHADAVTGGEREDPPLTLRPGWRYEIVNPERAAHPFELVRAGGRPADDRVQASQRADGPLETDPTVGYREAGDAVQFTVSVTFMDAVDGYRCGVRVATMRGAVRYLGR
jgi:hypothetical protein